MNVNTHSDGWLLHGIGGFTDACDAHITMITAPLIRGRVPIIVESVTTVTAPGEMIDVIVTERGIAVNPKRPDIIERLKGSSLPAQVDRGAPRHRDRHDGRAARAPSSRIASWP